MPKPNERRRQASKQEPKKPNYRLYLVVKDSPQAERGTWIPMGAAWEHSDGRGLNLAIDFLPMRMPGKTYSFVLREPLENDGPDEEEF